MLKKIIASALLSLLIAFACHCQGYYDNQCVAEKGEKGTQGEQEDNWSRKLIKKEYSVKNYGTYPGVIKILDDDTIKYDDEVLIVNNTCKYLKLIFQKGIIYPGIITGSVTVHRGLVTRQELDSLILLSTTDSLQITDFEELKFIKNSPKTKIFRFWLFSKGVVNPTVCFVALYNKTASRKTDIETFINGSRLTFFTKGWLVI